MKRYNRLLAAPLAAACALGMLLVAAGCASTRSSDSDARTERAASDDEIEVGYGTVSRETSTSAISTVSGEEARRQRTAVNLTDLIEGNVAGVYVREAPGGGVQVRIRGSSSIYGSNEPLYVVDGVPVAPNSRGTLSFVNPYDVASITVLKDAAATAIYGSRGGNGVIIIKTKSARD